jgi:hypothetical protein
MIDCICSIVNSALQSEILRSESLRALENAKSFTICNARECFEELQMPYSNNKELPLEFFVFPIIVAGLLLTRPTKSLTK